MNHRLILLLWVLLVLLGRHLPQVILDIRSRKRRTLVTVPSGIPASLMIGLWGVMHGFAIATLLGPEQGSDWLTVAGIAVLTSGGVLGLVALLTLGPSYHMNLLVAEGDKLVVRGIYRIVRHPMRLALAIETLGAIAISHQPFLVIPWGFLVVSQVVRSHREDRMLRAHYREEAVKYQASVPAVNLPFGMVVHAPRATTLNPKHMSGWRPR